MFKFNNKDTKLKISSPPITIPLYKICQNRILSLYGKIWDNETLYFWIFYAAFVQKRFNDHSIENLPECFGTFHDKFEFKWNCRLKVRKSAELLDRVWINMEAFAVS